MKTSFHRSLIASVIAAVCVAPAAFAKPHEDDQQQPQQGAPGAPGNSGKHQKKGKGAPQAAVVPQNMPGNVRPQAAGTPGRTGPQGPGVGIQGQRGPGRPGLNVFIPPPPIPPPPYYRRSYRRSATYVTDNNVSAVQSALKQRGYYRGGVDGDAGPGTRGAVVSFRQDNGLGTSSRIDEPLLRALGL